MGKQETPWFLCAPHIQPPFRSEDLSDRNLLMSDSLQPLLKVKSPGSPLKLRWPDPDALSV